METIMFSKRHKAAATKAAAESYQLAQAQKILDLFKVAKGKPARTMKELERWAASTSGREMMARHHDANGKIIP
jgi:hypothetical protein